mmetsp:Transcript_82626/g.130197  ORF Transcript_82626/g.130197 Transcript_82626/m.130197 type:complete len:103 (-) Transcript_82626:191-499(-)
MQRQEVSSLCVALLMDCLMPAQANVVRTNAPFALKTTPVSILGWSYFRAAIAFIQFAPPAGSVRARGSARCASKLWKVLLLRLFQACDKQKACCLGSHHPFM